MKPLIILPPLYTPFTVAIAVPVLLGALKKSGIEAQGLDINIDFYEYIFSKDVLLKALKEAKDFISEYESGAKYIEVKNKTEDTENSINNNEQKYNYICNFLQKNEKQISQTLDKVDFLKDFFKDKEDFYNPKKYIAASKIYQGAWNILSLNYYPSSFLYFKKTYKDIIENCLISPNRFLSEFFQKYVDKIKVSQDINMIGISVTLEEQLMPALLLAYMIKKQTDVKVVLGGGCISRIFEGFQNHKEMFRDFFDFILLDEGENSIVELYKYIKGELDIDEVTNLLYLKEDELICNKRCGNLDLGQNISRISFEGYDFSKYWCPNIIMPIFASRGCYWNKCSFCDYNYGNKYQSKPVEHVINEIKYFLNNFGITRFEFIDVAISPSYLKLLAEEIINHKLNIKYSIYLRYEEKFTLDLFKVAEKSGLVLINWGYEAESIRIVKLMKKHLEDINRIKILKNSNKAGIFNNVFSFIGFPTETKEEAELTLKTISNDKIFHISAPGFFILTRHCEIAENPREFGIYNVKESFGEFTTVLDYKAKNGINQNKAMEMIKEFELQNSVKNKDKFMHYIVDRQHALLFLMHYGVKEVKNMKISKKSFISNLFGIIFKR